MKTLFLKSPILSVMLISLSALFFSGCDDDEAVPGDGSKPTTISFGSNLELPENSAEKEIRIAFNKTAPQAGTLTLKVTTDVEAAFQTTPEVDNGLIEIDIEKGDTFASFFIEPKDNNTPDASRIIKFELFSVSDGFAFGKQTRLNISIVDDEVYSKPKSYVITGGSWKSEKTYVYDENGRVWKIHWKTETPGLRTGTDTYYYNTSGLLTRINRFPNLDEYYYRDNGRVVRSEEIEHGVKKSYSEYDYDSAGNLGAKRTFYRQASGAFELSFIYVYLYYTNGDLFVQLTYTPRGGLLEPTLISTLTFGGYIDGYNPFPVEILPGIAAQQTLPTTYRVEENDRTLDYHFSYEYREDGRPSVRNTSGAGTETTVYHYY